MAIIPAGRHKKKTGSPRMKEFGYKQVTIWLDESEAKLVVSAAKRAGKKIATWVRKVAFDAAIKSV